MRVLHVVSLHSPTGAFGGPVTVAANQVRTLRERGVQAELAAGWDGPDPVPGDVAGVPAALFRARRWLPLPRFAGYASPGLLRHVARRARDVDVVHVHLARDLMTLPTALLTLLARRRLIVQCHGMVAPDRRLAARLLDGLLTRRALRGADSILSLSTLEDAQLREVAHALPQIVRVTNPVRAGSPRPLCHDQESQAEVLFCSRLHPVKQVMVFAEAARLLRSQGSTARFVVVGPDGGDLERLRSFQASSPGLLDYEGPLPPEAVRARLRRADVFVLPSEREQVPMVLLEALSEGVPCVVTDRSTLTALLRQEDAAVLVAPQASTLAEALAALLEDEDERRRLAHAGVTLVALRFGPRQVSETLCDAYGARSRDR